MVGLQEHALVPHPKVGTSVSQGSEWGFCPGSGSLLWANGFGAPRLRTDPDQWGPWVSHRSSSSSRPFMSRMSSCCRACSAPRVASRSRASRCARCSADAQRSLSCRALA